MCFILSKFQKKFQVDARFFTEFFFVQNIFAVGIFFTSEVDDQTEPKLCGYRSQVLQV
jgi:hypothetical protein